MTAPATDRAPPDWCGQCDKTTRLIDHAGVLVRCRCHPDAPRLRQFRTCPECHDQIYEWEFETHTEAHHYDTIPEEPVGKIFPEKTAPPSDGRTAYEAFMRSLTARNPDVPFLLWERLDDLAADGYTSGDTQADWVASAQAVLKDAGISAEERDLIFADLGDMLEILGLGDYARPYSAHKVFRECITKAAALTEQLGVLRDRIDSLARGLDMSASTTAPSKKSDIEAACASALRGLLRIDGESADETRQRLDRDRAGEKLPS